ncbi:MAG: hypothetical protein HYY93_03065 [Planctomycetes bacterium]|nr:hypothetical protein [Planctomycetota bacterium]
MPDVSLVVSHPPFRDGVAAAAVAPLLGQAAFETNLFLKYPLPDLLKIAPDPAAAEAAVRPFHDAGVAADIVSYDVLCSMPPPLTVQSFRFTDHGLLFLLDKEDLIAPFDALRLLVTWRMAGEFRGAALAGPKVEKPRGGRLMGHVAFAVAGPIGSMLVNHLQEAKADFARARAARAALKQKAGPEKLIADLYLLREGSFCRVRLDQGELDYSGLGPLLRPESLTNWNTLLGEFRKRSTAMKVNDDMIRTRPPAVTGKYLTVERVIDQQSLKQYQINYPEFYSALLAWRIAEEMAGLEGAGGLALELDLPVAELAGGSPTAPADNLPVAELVEPGPPPPAGPLKGPPPGWGRKS